MPFKQGLIKKKITHTLKSLEDKVIVRQDRWIRKSDLSVDFDNSFRVKKLEHKFVVDKQEMSTPQ